MHNVDGLLKSKYGVWEVIWRRQRRPNTAKPVPKPDATLGTPGSAFKFGFLPNLNFLLEITTFVSMTHICVQKSSRMQTREATKPQDWVNTVVRNAKWECGDSGYGVTDGVAFCTKAVGHLYNKWVWIIDYCRGSHTRLLS